MVDEQIQSLKTAFGVKTDKELADVLMIDKRAVASWRSRDVLPRRYADILTGKTSYNSFHTSEDKWDEYEWAGARIAHFRLNRALAPFANSANIRNSLSLYRKVADKFKWLRMESQHSLVKIMEADGVDLGNAEAAFIADDLLNSDVSIKRDQMFLGVHEILQTIVSEKAPSS
jgi:hypothetical protein